MNIDTFIEELACFFPMTGTENEKKKRILQYRDIIAENVAKRGCNYNYQKLLRHLQMNFDKFPPLPKIIENLPVGVILEEQLSGREGEVITRKMNGVEYDFYIVPNSWENVMSVGELDRDIQRRRSNEKSKSESESF